MNFAIFTFHIPGNVSFPTKPDKLCSNHQSLNLHIIENKTKTKVKETLINSVRPEPVEGCDF